MNRFKANRLSICIAVLFVYLTTDQAYADTFRVQDVVKSALKHHPKIKAAQEKLRIQRAKSLSLLGQFDETLSFDGAWALEDDYPKNVLGVSLKKKTDLWGTRLYGSWKRGDGDFASYDPRESGNGGKGSIGVQVPFLKGGAIDKDRAELASQELSGRQSEEELKLEQMKTAWEAANSYWIFRAFVKKNEIAEELLALAKTRIKQIEGRVQSGALPDIDKIDNQRTVLKRQGAATLALRKVQASALKLSLYWRDDNGTMVIATADDMPEVNDDMSMDRPVHFKEDLKRALAMRPDFKVLRQQKAQWSIKRRLAKNNILPTLDGFAEASRDLGSDSFGYTDRSILLGVRFKLPIRQRDARGQAAAASSGEALVDQRIAWLTNQVETEIRDAHSEIRAMQETLDLAKQERTFAHQVEAAERQRYDLGSSNLLNVTLREKAAAESEKRVIEAELALRIALNRYRLLMGELPS